MSKHSLFNSFRLAVCLAVTREQPEAAPTVKEKTIVLTEPTVQKTRTVEKAGMTIGAPASLPASCMGLVPPARMPALPASCANCSVRRCCVSR